MNRHYVWCRWPEGHETIDTFATQAEATLYAGMCLQSGALRCHTGREAACA